MRRLIKILDAAISTSLDLTGFDFVDFGASAGGAGDFARKHLGGTRGLALDIDPRKVAQVKARGHDAVVCDVTSLAEVEGQVRFAILFHFLEHLQNLRAAIRCLRSAVSLAGEFVYVQQPWFDSDEYLREVGLQLYWSNWTAHRNHMLSEHFGTYLNALALEGAITGYTVWGHERLVDSSAPDIHSLGSGKNQGKWQSGINPPKPHVLFDSPVYREIRCFIRLSAAKPVSKLERHIIARSGDNVQILHGERAYPPVVKV